MEDKNERNQKIIDKIKSIKNISPSNKELFKKKISDEANDKISYNNYPFKTQNISKVSFSPFNHNKKSISTEKELFRGKQKNKSKDKEKNRTKNNSTNKSKNLTPLIHKYKKKNFYDIYHNNEVVRDESIDKKNKLYENQRKPSFLKKYIAQIKDNGTGERKVSVDKLGRENEDINNYSFRKNSKQNDSFKNLIENYKNLRPNIEENNGKKETEKINEQDKEEKILLNQLKNRSFNKKKVINIIENEENKKERKSFIKNKNNPQNINYEKNSIIIDNKINIFVNDFPQKNFEDRKIYKKMSPNFENQKKRNKGKNRSVEIRKKKALLPDVNIISNSNPSNNIPNSNVSTEGNNTLKGKTEDSNCYSIYVNKEIILSKKQKIPKLTLNSKQIKTNINNNNSMTERSRNSINNNVLCILCGKKSKKPLMCPKCHKVCCEQCIKNKKKKNKFCSFCNNYLRDISQYIEIKNINNKRIIKNKKAKEVKEDSLYKISGQYSNNKPLNQKTPSFKEKNISDKKNKKTRKQIKTDSEKYVNEENNEDKNLYNDRKNKYHTDIKKEKIKENESIDINEFDTYNNQFSKTSESKKENNENAEAIIDNSNQEKNGEEENNYNNTEKMENNINQNEIEINNNCLIHNNKEINYYCFQCDKDYCEECMLNHSNEHNLIDYSYIDKIKFKELLSEKNDISKRNSILQNYINDFEQKIKNYNLEKDLFISEINKIANNYINNIESQINEIKTILEKVKAEQNSIIEKNKLLNEYFNMVYKLNIEKINDKTISGDFPENFEKIELDNADYSKQVPKNIKDKNCFKFNYFTSEPIKDFTINNNSNTILFSNLNFDIDNINNFLNDLKSENKNNINNSNDESIELKNFMLEDEYLTNNIFSIKNWNNKALIHTNIYLNQNIESNNYFINNVSCFLLISNNEINNYCQLEKKFISKGNLCLYDLVDWEKFNIFNYRNLCFKIILFNHNK